jgi:hypothetical protein
MGYVPGRNRAGSESAASIAGNMGKATLAVKSGRFSGVAAKFRSSLSQSCGSSKSGLKTKDFNDTSDYNQRMYFIINTIIDITI